MVSGQRVHDNRPMPWLELPPLVTDVAAQLPALEPLVLVAGQVEDCVEALWPEERRAIARAHPRRACEFATGRALARRALVELGLDRSPIPRAEDRRPVWPAGVRGSITHANGIAIAAAARAEALQGVGIDLEGVERVTEKLYRKLFTHRELRELTAGGRRLASVMFSAKEAVYKAVNPQVGRYIGFQEAEVEVNWAERTLALRYIGHHEPNRIMEQGIGHFCFFGRYVLTVFIIE